jgi:DNA-binding winged helix-turn-helix (wHTH) protein
MSPSPLENDADSRLDFGTFALDPRTGEVWRGQRLVHVTRLPARLLRYLALNRLRTVSKAELLAELWAGLSVEDATLQQAIRAARKAVGDDGRRQDVIATVSGVGYRFVAEPLNASPLKVRPRTAPEGAPEGASGVHLS